MAMLLRSLRARLINRCARNFRNYADLAVEYEERVWDSNGTHNRVLRMPSGPAVVITPWNAPLMLSTWKIAPALAAGSHRDPEAGGVVAALVLAARRPRRRGGAACRACSTSCRGSARRSAPLSSPHPRVRRISFTGSPETARHIGVAAARNIVPFTGELGGKGPLLVFEDCDLEAAARKAAGQYDDSGQVCLAGTRLLVAGERAGRVPRALPPLRRRARARRPARRRDHGLADDPSRPRRPGAGLRRAGARERRRDRARRQPPRARSLGRADADRAALERQRGRAARGLRARAHLPDVRRRGRGGDARELDALRALGDRLHRLARSAPNGSAARCARGSCGSTPSSSAT